MAPPPRRRSRALLWGWALVSLLLVAWTGLLFASSVPATQTAANGMAHGEEAPFDAGERLVVEPLRAPHTIGTAYEANGSIGAFGGPGDVVYYLTGNRTLSETSPFPFQNPGGGVARAVAYVERNATTGTWDLPFDGVRDVTRINVTALPARDNESGEVRPMNVTLDLANFTGEAGFIVKRDAAAAPESALVPAERVVGRIIEARQSAQMWAGFAVAGIGFLIPMILIIQSHRGRGVAGVPGAEGPGCPECGKPVENPELGFCARCGADFRARM